MIARLLLLIVATLLVGALAQQPPPLGSHEFEPVTIALAPEMNFPVTARVVARNYSVQTPFPGILRGIGYRLAVGKSDNAAGVAFDVVVGAMSTLFDAAIGIGYYGARLGVRTNPATGQVVRGRTRTNPDLSSRLLIFSNRQLDLRMPPSPWSLASFTLLNGRTRTATASTMLPLRRSVDMISRSALGVRSIHSSRLPEVHSYPHVAPIDYGVLEQGGVPYFYAQTQTTDGVFAFRVISSGHYITSTEVRLRSPLSKSHCSNLMFDQGHHHCALESHHSQDLHVDQILQQLCQHSAPLSHVRSIGPDRSSQRSPRSRGRVRCCCWRSRSRSRCSCERWCIGL